MKSEVDRRKTFETWQLAFMASAEYYYCSDVVRSDFCKVELSHWEGDDPF